MRAPWICSLPGPGTCTVATVLCSEKDSEKIHTFELLLKIERIYKLKYCTVPGIRTKTGRQNVSAHEFSLILQQKKHFLDTVAHTTQVYKYDENLQCLTTRIHGKKEFAGISRQTVRYANIIEDSIASPPFPFYFYCTVPGYSTYFCLFLFFEN